MVQADFPVDVFPSYAQTPILPGLKRTLIVWAWSRLVRQQEGTTDDEEIVEIFLWEGNAYYSFFVIAVDTCYSVWTSIDIVRRIILAYTTQLGLVVGVQMMSLVIDLFRAYSASTTPK